MQSQPVGSGLPTPEQIAKLPPDGGDEFNRLIFESSPYLLQHARNPVDWHAWNDETLAKAKAEDKPILLSVGYSTCHWCHVMEHESFEQVDVAEIINELYIPIKVDREERPDIDAIYITATTMMTGSAGWPNNLWLTPDGKPFFARTYVPRGEFKQVLRQLATAFQTRRSEVQQVGDDISAALSQHNALAARAESFEPTREPLTRGLSAAAKLYDPLAGGLGHAPKFPPHGWLSELTYDLHRDGAQEKARQMLTYTLDSMARGGIHDHIGGGFHRYSTDDKWFLPHFEKMLYDNAQLARAYVDAYLLTGDEAYKRVADDTLGWVLREMQGESGGFYSALDADSEGEEGKFYVWTQAEVEQLLGRDDAALFARYYGLKPEGNFADEATGVRSGASIVYLPKPLAKTAEAAGESLATVMPKLEAARAKLMAARDKRVRPHLDDKVIVSWNGLMIGALAYAGKQLNEPKYTDAATRAADFILGNMRGEGQLLHTWRLGKASVPAYLDDYACLIDGLLELHIATDDAKWLNLATELAAEMQLHYADTDGSYFYTSDAGGSLIVRRKDSTDDVTPSGNGMAARAMARLALLSGDDQYEQRARGVLAALSGTLTQSPMHTESLNLAAGGIL